MFRPLRVTLCQADRFRRVSRCATTSHERRGDRAEQALCERDLELGLKGFFEDHEVDAGDDLRAWCTWTLAAWADAVLGTILKPSRLPVFLFHLSIHRPLQAQRRAQRPEFFARLPGRTTLGRVGLRVLDHSRNEFMSALMINAIVLGSHGEEYVNHTAHSNRRAGQKRSVLFRSRPS
jgi:hypothetical protein